MGMPGLQPGGGADGKPGGGRKPGGGIGGCEVVVGAIQNFVRAREIAYKRGGRAMFIPGGGGGMPIPGGGIPIPGGGGLNEGGGMPGGKPIGGNPTGGYPVGNVGRGGGA